jgi:hypothetical protein
MTTILITDSTMTGIIKRKYQLLLRFILIGFSLIISLHLKGQESNRDRLMFLEIGGQSPYYSINYNINKFKIKKHIWIPSIGIGYLGIDNYKTDFLLKKGYNYLTLNFRNELNRRLGESRNYLLFGLGMTLPIDTKLKNDFIQIVGYDSYFSASIGYNYVTDRFVYGIKYSPIFVTDLVEDLFAFANADGPIHMINWFGFSIGLRL